MRRLEAGQIPWAKSTKVLNSFISADSRREGTGISSVELERADSGLKATIYRYGDVDLKVDTRFHVRQYMSRSASLTRSAREYFKIRGGGHFVDNARDWLKGLNPTPIGPSRDPVGVLDWKPARKEKAWKKVGKVAYHGAGRAVDYAEHWIGTFINYVHFRNDYEDEGMVILWEGENEPEVWLGDVDNFFWANEEDFDSPESYQGYNEAFENGFLWALYEMSVFEQDGSIPDWAIDIISADPDVMWPELVQQLLPMLRYQKEPLQKALAEWLARRQDEADAAGGQLRLWPKSEPS